MKAFIIFLKVSAIAGLGLSCKITREKAFLFKILIDFGHIYTFDLQNILCQMNSIINQMFFGKCFLLCQCSAWYYWLPDNPWIMKKWVITAYFFYSMYRSMFYLLLLLFAKVKNQRLLIHIHMKKIAYFLVLLCAFLNFQVCRIVFNFLSHV